MNKKKTSTHIKDLAIMGAMVAIIEVAKLQLAFIPNVELVSLLIILFTLYLGKKIYFVLAAFVLIEGVLYGFGTWWFMYLYTWPLLATLTLLLRKQKSVWTFSFLSGLFGLLFGALCSITYFFISGWAGGFSYFIAGIPYDLIHGASNFIICLVLFKPLHRALNRLKNDIGM